jgi:hypothetical protein
MSHWGLLLAAVIGVGSMSLALKAQSEEKPGDPSTAAQLAQTECIRRASETYLKDKLLLLPQSEDVSKLKFLSVDKIIEKRRLQERYCLQRAQCMVTSSANELSGATQAATFDGCLRDEALEDNDAAPHESAPNPN